MGTTAMIAVGGQVVARATIPTSGTATASIRLEDGRHQLSIWLVDAAGNVSASRTLMVTVDTVPPEQPEIALDPATAGRHNLVVHGERSARARAILGGPDRMELSGRIGSSGTLSFDHLELVAGTWLIQVLLTDAAGNDSPLTTLETYVHLEPPDAPTARIIAEDGSPKVLLELDGTPGAHVLVTLQGPRPHRVEVELDDTGRAGQELMLDNGVWIITASALDWRGLRSDVSTQVQHTVLPALILQVDETHLPSGDLTWSVQTEPGVTVHARLLDHEGSELQEVSGNDGRLSSIRAGSYVLAVSATDQFGNSRAAEWSFDVPAREGATELLFALTILAAMGYGAYRGARFLAHRSAAHGRPLTLPPPPPDSGDRLR